MHANVQPESYKRFFQGNHFSAFSVNYQFITEYTFGRPSAANGNRLYVTSYIVFYNFTI